MMGSAATATVAALHPGQIAGLDDFAGTTAIVLLYGQHRGLYRCALAAATMHRPRAERP